MTVALTVLTNGRADCIDQSIDAALANLKGLDIEHVLICDDSGDEAYHQWLTDRFTDPRVRFIGEGVNAGFARAMRRAWDAYLATDCDHLFLLEEDFILQRPVDLAAMARVLAEEPALVQLMLKRQPWFENEKKAGGIIEYRPDFYTDHTNGTDHWVSYPAFWSNPYLAERAFIETHQWPDCDASEAAFSTQIDKEGSCGAFWGRRADPPLVEHVGIRSGYGY